MKLNQSGIWAVVPAAGKGERMKCSIPKQYLSLGDDTIIEITIRKLLSISFVEGVVLVLDKEDEYWNTLGLAKDERIKVAVGSSTRSGSVLAGLKKVKEHFSGSSRQGDDHWVLVHDAARPCFHLDKVLSLMQEAERNGVGAILARPVSDTVKHVDAQVDANKNYGSSPSLSPGENKAHVIVKSLERDALRLAHTPQIFKLAALIEALEFCSTNEIPVTDESSAMEAVGSVVSCIEDTAENIKVTRSEDLDYVRFLVAKSHPDKRKV